MKWIGFIINSVSRDDFVSLFLPQVDISILRYIIDSTLGY